MEENSFNTSIEEVRNPTEVELDVVSRVNFSSSQNGVSILKRLVLRNLSELPLENVKVSLECHPALIRPKTWPIDRIAADGEQALSQLDTPLDNAMLAGLNEAEVGELCLKVEAGDAILHEETRRIEMLARDEWGGIGEMAHLLAAYVSPNEAVVAAVLKDAAKLLEATGQNGAIDGYQSNSPARTWMLAGAIWSALTGLGLTYAVPPASFEVRGQKIRDPARIRAEGLGTCLDLSLLAAACFEAAGLNPVVLFSEGHAWVGVWLTDRDFGTISEPDVMTVRKATDAREFVMLESTLLTRRPTVGFEEAAAAGREHTAERNEHTFQLAVDIRRARAARIRPLASHRADDTIQSAEIPASPAALPKPLDFGLLPDDMVEEEPKTAADRISRWQRKLLDLSLRNRLLNFKDTKQTLPFLCPDVSTLEDQLADGKKFRTLPLKDEDPLGNRDLLISDEHQMLAEVARDAFAKGQIAVPLTGKEANNRLLELYRRANSDLQEGGTNTLFLAAGFLRWKKTEGDTRSYRAPLVLIPVKLTRRSAQSDFIIEHHEDDVRFNFTLLEFLKRDFALSIPELEGDLPHDESGYDLPRIFETMRRKVRDVAGFEVVEDVALSTFSFAKFLMWKDLVDRTDSLRESALVKHLVDSPAEPFLPDGAEGLPVATDVDRRIQPKDLFTPLPADSSQLAAVLAAQEGHDFVLIGPPGTGKSQTIANIISQCLAIGKTVLFVAEKSAALDVVYRRLAANGLGDAVLELHSNKADRKSVLDQLGRSWERISDTSPGEWIKVTEDLVLTREGLNAYVKALHLQGTQGFSVFQAIGQAAAGDAGFSLGFDNKDAHDAESYAYLKRLSETLGRRHEIVRERPALDLVRVDDWSFTWQAELLAKAASLKALSVQLIEAAERLAAAAGFSPDAALSPGRVEKLVALTDIPAHGEDVSWALSRDPGKLASDIAQLTTLLRGYQDATAQLAASYPMERLKSIPLEKLDADWRLAQTKIWPFSVFAKSSVRKLLQTYATAGAANPASDIRALSEARESRAEIDASALKDCPLFAGTETDGDHLARWLAEATAMRNMLDRFTSEVADAAVWTNATQALAARSRDDLRDKITTFRQYYDRWNEEATAFAKLTGSEPKAMPLRELGAGLQTIVDNKDFLADWVQWVEVREQGRTFGLDNLVSALETGSLAMPAADAFETAYAAWWLPLAMDAEICLRRFTHWSHEDRIKQFRALDSRAAEIAASQVLHRIRHGLPARDGVPKRSELGTLRHQLSLQRPSMPIRTLISEMPGTFTKLAPCVLMSPLSVAQYLPAGQAAFDVVIFDEASQITTWDAIGAIARGKQAIIVGDPKQLPPTNFFGRSDDSEEDVPEIERDLSSILDEVEAAGIPTQQLDWHYRSRDESLIAFSNWHYYGGRLVTFPSPETQSMAVQLHRVDGVYARGKGRTNETEARAIVKMAVARMNEWLQLPDDDRQTLGVITFNGEQQSLILDLLDAERRDNPDLEWFFEDAREEPVIVKNLENIQGDERDVMLFSITFGHDAAGKLSMAFGALNGDGGERRLNVAVTRARRELHIFASISADEIDLTRTKAIGVKHLKAFLDYAARGAVALPAQDEGSVGPVESPFEAAVKTALQQRGWEVRSQIGVSGFRIDLGIVHPDHAGAYLAGLECDGATYHRSATARDRDKVRQAVLEGLGWTILRIWSTDWFRNRQAVVDRIHIALVERLEADREERSAAAARREAEEQVSGNAGPAPEPEEAFPAVEASEQDTDEPGGPVDEAEIIPLRPPREEQSDETEWQERLVARAAPGNASQTFEQEQDQTPDAEAFYDRSYDPILKSLITRIVEKEGPLPVALLGRRISAVHGWQRTGRRIAERVQECLGDCDIHSENGVEFVWKKDSYRERVAYRTGLDRSIREISRTEIASLYDAHAQEIDNSDDPVLELARRAGIARLSADARDYLAGCIIWLKQDGVASG